MERKEISEVLTRRGRWTVAAVLALAVAAVVRPGPAADDTLAQNLRPNVVSVNVKRGGQTASGFGFVIGERGGFLYVATVNHLIRGETPAPPGSPTPAATVGFFEAGGTSTPAEILGAHDFQIDLAFLKVRRPEGAAWLKASLRPEGRLERGTQVWFVGKGTDWYVPVNPGRVNKESRGKIVVDDLSILPGCSGAPLIASDGLAGMVQRDEGANVANALSITVIGDFAKEKNVPWDLGQAEARRVQTAPPSANTGKMCARIQGAPAGVTLAVAESDLELLTGNFQSLGSGQCIDLAPGSYVHYVDDEDLDCNGDGETAVVTAGNTTQVVLDCQEMQQIQAVNIAGDWYTPEGTTVRIIGAGAAYQFVEYNVLGVAVANGTIRVDGINVSFQAYNAVYQVYYSGEMVFQGNSMVGTAYLPGGITSEVVLSR